MGDAGSSSPNVEMFKLHLLLYDNFKNVGDYLVVMAYGLLITVGKSC
jgi:hypothetical protein